MFWRDKTLDPRLAAAAGRHGEPTPWETCQIIDCRTASRFTFPAGTPTLSRSPLRPVQMSVMKLSLPPLTLRLEPATAAPGPRITPGTYGAVAKLQQDGSLLLLIGQTRLRAPAAAGLADGERLTVRLARRGDGLTAEIVGRERAAPATTAAADTLRQLLPRQGSVAGAVRAAVATADAGGTQPLSAPARQALEELVAAVRRPAEVADAEGLRQALRDSGSLYEWVLARFPEAAGQAGRRDLAALLMRLVERLQTDSRPDHQATRQPAQATAEEAPPPRSELVSLAEAALARLRLLQLQPAQAGDSGVDLAFQLALRDGESLDELYLRIRSEHRDEESGPDATQGALQVALVFDFEEGGRLEARLRYQAGGISGEWWSDRDDLRRALEDGLPLLRERLESAGLTVGRLEARPGSPAPLPDDVLRPAGGLIHESV